MYPFVKCYLLIHGNTEGIYLASRYVYPGMSDRKCNRFLYIAAKEKQIYGSHCQYYVCSFYPCMSENIELQHHRYAGSLAYGIRSDGRFKSVPAAAFYNRGFACLCSIVLPIYDIGICAVYDWPVSGKDRKKKPLE